MILGLGASACQRKAPSPEECHAAALRWVAAELGPARAPATPDMLRALEKRILERATTCLTMPFDREAVTCMTGGAAPAACLDRLEARRAPKR